VDLGGLWAEPLAWLAAGLVILLVDLFLGMVLLPFAVAAGLLAVGALVDRLGWLGGFALLPSWQAAAIAYGVLVVVGYVVVRGTVGRGAGSRPDVNEY
jgi:membrane protein implicated in regulation of membrane protease activity